MAWTYSKDPSTSPKDKYRFLLSDTDENDPIMQDEEILYIIATYETENQRLYQMFQRAADIIGREVKRKLGPQSEDPTGRQRHFSERASFYKKQLTAGGLSSPPYKHPKSFRKGMHDNV